MIEDFKLILEVRYFNYFFLFCVGRVKRSGHFGCLLWWQGYLWYAFGYRVGGENDFWNWAGDWKAWSSNTGPLQPRIPSFTDALRHLETLGYWNVVQYQVGCPELAICVDKHLGL